MRIDTLIENARITTVDPSRPTAERLGILNGRIIGIDDDLDGVVATDRVDLGGAPVVPGFNDAHFHFSMVGLEMVQLDLTPATTPDLETLYARVRDFAGSREEGSWVLAQGYDQNKLGGTHPDREVLDRIAGGRPVYLLHNSHHMAVVNSEALRRAGHTDPDQLTAPVGGELGRRSDGTFSGLLQEQAMTLVTHVLRPVGQEALVEGLAAASRWCAQHGITSATEPGVGGTMIGHGPADVRAYQVARERGLLHTRLTLMPYIDALHSIGDIGAGPAQPGWGIDLGVRSGFGDEWVSLGPVKIMSDGSLIGRTAAMCCDYHDTPGNSGFLQWEQDDLHDLLVTAHVNGWQVAAHAIGDRAIDVVLDAFDDGQRILPRPDARHRLEHVAVASDAQVDRIVSGGYIPVPQGRFISELGDGFASALGSERLDLAYRMRSFVDAGVELPGSTDAPVVSGEPLPSLHDMVNRRSATGVSIGAREALTPAQALRAYTHGSAHAVHEERFKGTLTPGKAADLVVLSDDPMSVPPDRIRDIEVRATMVGGVFRHDAEGVLSAAL
ncbi:amidohydrolase [Leucobacter sp. Psy1]|uniref:amidohydrolase n=1 Tax=Leucobacter sp. Psy1 TaxID=2875729 RepID=UPI001CD560A2|nr:amidohydrolase [Leucobacter sp. Psy1]UBH06927.1 amidohydrolase [Leucobacter sp. Psy1]